MEWYVLNYEWNKRKIIKYNIFNNINFKEGIENLLKEFITYEDFIERLDSLLKYCFWCKREYEISVGDLFEQDLNKYEKIDVYSQIKPNIKILAKYIIDKYNE